MRSFETNPKSIKHLLTQIHNGELALPDFQRDFVWDPGAVEELIESIMRNYPAGSLLFLKHGGNGFQVREFEGAPKLTSKIGTSYLVLDGQQRLTSLYQAFFGKGEHRFFLDIKVLIETGDIEDAVWHESLKRSERRGLLSIETQAERLICPLEVVMNDGFASWVDSVMDRRPEKSEASRDLRTQLRNIEKNHIQSIMEYHFPVVTLGDQTPLDAVCKMFETLNRRGVKLTVFELLMARSFASNVSLRKLWDDALEENPVLSEFDIDPYYVLQIVSLLNGKSIKRSQILETPSTVVEKYWTQAIHSLSESIIFLRRNCGVLSPKLLPYNTMLVPLAAVWSRTSDLKGPKDANRRLKISQWFWSSVFAQTYEIGPSSRAGNDFRELESWIRGSEVEPYSIRKLHFNAQMFHEVTPKQRALYRGTLALILSKNSLDFHKAEPLTFDYLEKNGVDDHHIFPEAFLKKKIDPSRVNCIVNRTLIDRRTNNRISAKAPSTYFSEMELALGMKTFSKILESHLIPSESLKNDDFESFLENRAVLLMKELQDRMLREIPATSSFEENEHEEFEDDERSISRDRFSLSEINQPPSHLLENIPHEVESLFNDLCKTLRDNEPEIWWRANLSRVGFYGKRKFATCRISKTGLHLTVFTRSEPLESVTPIVQRDDGGKLWGRLKIRNQEDLTNSINIIFESLSRVEKALAAGEGTSWWAAARKKDRVA